MINNISSIDYLVRKIYNIATYPLQRKALNGMCNIFKSTETHSDQFLHNTVYLSEMIMKDKNVVCNFESGIFDKLAESNMPVIFIMNHSNQKKDSQMLMILNSLLNLSYLGKGKSEVCPQSRIIMNNNILKSANEKFRYILEKLGAVGINVWKNNKNTSTETSENAANMLKLINEYVANKSNIFMFPEGIDSVLKSNLPLDSRIQNGILKFITRILESNKGVKVVPVGFAYNQDKKVYGAIHVGEPIYYRKSKQGYISNQGKHLQELLPKSLKYQYQPNVIEHFNDKSTIMNDLVRNMKECIAQAQEELKNPNEFLL